MPALAKACYMIGTTVENAMTMRQPIKVIDETGIEYDAMMEAETGDVGATDGQNLRPEGIKTVRLTNGTQLRSTDGTEFSGDDGLIYRIL